MQNVFGAGAMWGTPTSDAYGNFIYNATPIQFGVAQEVGLDVAFDTKMLYGSLQLPVAIGRGKGKIGLKFKFAQINGATLNSLFFGQTLQTALLGDVWDTTGTSITATVTVTPPLTATFAADLGVKNSLGQPLTRTYGNITTGQYTVSPQGVYTFATVDIGQTAFISYQYSGASTTAKKSFITSLPMGYAPTFRTDIYMPFQGKSMVWTLNNCVASKLAMATKLDDFMIPEIDADVFADAAGNIGQYGITE